MPPVTRRPGAPPAAPQYEEVNFGDLGVYATGGFNVPEGDYALRFETMMYAAPAGPNRPSRAERLGIMITYFPMHGDSWGEPMHKFLSMGSKAHESFMPHPETGKGIVRRPDGAGGQLTGKSNWGIVLDSMYQAGMPKGVFQNDVTVIDGIWVHVQSIPEPEERKGFAKNQTAEVEQEERQGGGMIPVITALLDGGKPWEGGGGLPDGAEQVPSVPAPRGQALAPVAPKPAARPVAKPAAVAPKAVAPKPAAGPKRVAPAPVAAPEPAESTDEDLAMAASNAVTAVLSDDKNAAGMRKLDLRMQTFKQFENDEQSQATATAVINTYFSSDDNLNVILGPLGYVCAGGQIKQA